jgi:hypothetical protein
MPLTDEQKWLVYAAFLAGRCFAPHRRPGEKDLVEFVRDPLKLTTDDLEVAVAQVVDQEQEQNHLDQIDDHDWMAAG